MSEGQPRISVQSISKRVHVCLGPGTLSNTAVFVGERAVLAADTMLTPKLASQVQAVVRRVTDRPIRYVLNTHSDTDHVFGNQQFCQEGILMSHKLTRDRVLQITEETVKMAAQRRPHLKADLEEVRIVAPEVAFDGNLDVELGGLQLQCLYAGPAHTPGDVVVWVPEERCLFTSDLLFNGIFPVMRNAEVNGWLRALDRLEALNPRAVVPGHGPVGDAALISTMRELLTEVRDRVQEAVTRGLSLQQALQEVQLPQYRRLPRAEERIPEAITRLHAALQPAKG